MVSKLVHRQSGGDQEEEGSQLDEAKARRRDFVLWQLPPPCMHLDQLFAGCYYERG